MNKRGHQTLVLGNIVQSTRLCSREETILPYHHKTLPRKNHKPIEKLNPIETMIESESVKSTPSVRKPCHYDTCRKVMMEDHGVQKHYLGIPTKSLKAIVSPSRTGLRTLHDKFADELYNKQRQRDETSCAEDKETERPTKRRRYARRNSKTAAMLFDSMSSLLDSGIGDVDDSHIAQCPKEDSCRLYQDSVDIAEDLVRQLKLRRRIQAET